MCLSFVEAQSRRSRAFLGQALVKVKNECGFVSPGVMRSQSNSISTELGDRILNDYQNVWGQGIFARLEPGKGSENLKARDARYAARVDLLKGQSAKILEPPPASPDSNNDAASSAKRRRARAPQRSPRPTLKCA
jgi:hypothetical protein